MLIPAMPFPIGSRRVAVRDTKVVLHALDCQGTELSDLFKLRCARAQSLRMYDIATVHWPD